MEEDILYTAQIECENLYEVDKSNYIIYIGNTAIKKDNPKKPRLSRNFYQRMNFTICNHELNVSRQFSILNLVILRVVVELGTRPRSRQWAHFRFSPARA